MESLKFVRSHLVGKFPPGVLRDQLARLADDSSHHLVLITELRYNIIHDLVR